MERGESSGSRRVISAFETTACTAAERAKPSIRAHKISQAIPKAMERASRKPVSKLIFYLLSTSLPWRTHSTGAGRSGFGGLRALAVGPDEAFRPEFSRPPSLLLIRGPEPRSAPVRRAYPCEGP